MEIQDMEPKHGFALQRVGFMGVKKRVHLHTPEGEIAFDLSIDVYVDIGGERRGAHLSRNAEALLEALDAGPASRSLEEYLESVVDKLLDKHPYATKAESIARTHYYVDFESSGIKRREPIRVEISVEKGKEGSRFWRVLVEVYGITVCPSAQLTVSSMAKTPPHFSPSHSQKVLLRGRISTRGKFVRIEDIARALIKGPSAPAFTLLKRGEEAALIISAFRNPRFIEDAVREASYHLVDLLRGYPPDTLIEVEAVSVESIHPHNLYAYMKATLGQLLESRSDDGKNA